MVTTGVLVLLAGCGDGADREASTASLTRYLPADSREVATVDFTAVKQQLGLAADQRLPTYDRLNVDISLQKDREAEADLYDAAALTVAPLFDPAASNVVALGASDRTADPLSKALDTSQITAAAANETSAEQPVTVIETTQPFDQLASALEKVGYRRDGASLIPRDASSLELTDAGNGVIVFGGNGLATSELVTSPPGGPPAQVSIIEAAKDVVAVAGAVPASSCLRAFGGWHDADGGQGVLRLELSDAAASGRLDRNLIDLDGGLEVGTPEADGDAVQLSYSLQHPENSVSPVGDLLQRTPLKRLYDCDA
ncbi:hypothetical protein BH10ACT11_BH10ACT11_03440 [soil metagenome]